MDELFLGLISGTSADAVDAALVSFSPTLKVEASLSHPIPSLLKQRIAAARRDSPFYQIAQLDVEVGELFAEAANRLLLQESLKAEDVTAIGSHGQTVWHEPDGNPAFTCQIGDPNVIAERTGITTVADFRRRDLAAGGQGAPLVPVFHQALFGDDNEARVVLNLGGIANITLLLPGEVASGFDTGPANALLDRWCLRHQGKPYDPGGTWAAQGTVVPDLLASLLDADYFRMPAPKSTGLEYFNVGFIEAALARLGGRIPPVDVQATLVELTAQTVADAIALASPAATRVLVCGGGAHNRYLMERLAQRLQPVRLETTAAFGLDPDYVEASAFAWLAMKTLHGAAGNEPRVTGANDYRVLGGIFRGQVSPPTPE
ncbi:anhydro-N-acetylmuramic acid kinase [Alkalilimnicola ehrlichii]|uniref:Anhydro-N-acetylmuramic acid kinase n=1 Tax=Alkalilimnicola ehrlichii TaxID=351052 RepID=A0A3E0X3Y3_9GAMM|nr:anhydro-N-acetylmuramic acid kinase [Alkalilimnicola ehrlichii]RFA31472.1 anhydro-N-acetylmuramic acid kinase [Alkalilimnicola ehrlichii]RFA39256.1 anhydro-N-acetylmuramic acid kinase [Alkalilimnicola ehrlichii]